MAQLTQPGRNDNSDEGQPRIVARKGADPATGLLTVLLVDEDEDLRMYLRRCLEQIGPLLGQVFEASNGREALAVVQINDVDLLICGAQVSQMSDEALFSAIRADPGTASILIMQIADNELANERLLRTRASLADAILDSPFNAAGFGACLARLIQSQ